MDKDIASTLNSDYRILFNSINEGICIIEKVDTGRNERVDYRYILANPAFERITGLTDVVGKTVLDVVQGVNDSTMQEYDNILKTGQPVRFETYETALDQWYSTYAFPIDDPELKRVAVIFNDISDIKKSEIILQENAARKEYMLKLSDAMRSIQDTVQIELTACRVLGEQIGASRVLYGDVINEQEVNIRCDYVNGVPSIAACLNASDVSQFVIDSYLSGKPVVIKDVSVDPRLSEEERTAFQSIQVAANISLGLVKDGKWVAALIAHHNEPRNWTPFEVSLMEETAERTWEAVERARAEQKYRLLFNLIDQGFFVIDVFFDENDKPVDMYYVEANHEATKILSIDYTGKRLRDIDSNYEEYWFEIFGKVAMTGQSVRMAQYAEPDKKWYNFYIFKIGDEKSHRIGNIFLDITESKRAEEALKESEQLYRTLFENTEDGFVLVQPIFDESGYSDNYLILNMNQAWEKQTGLKADDFVGKTLKESMPGVESSWPEAFANVAKSGESIHFDSFNHVSNRWYDLYAFNYKEGLVGILFQDISERKKIEEVLRESEERFRVVQDISPDGFTILHPVRDEKGTVVDFTFVYQNDAIARIGGTDPGKIYGKRLLDVFPGHRGTSIFEAYMHVASTGESQILEEASYIGENIQTLTWFRLIVVSIGEDIMIMAQDISERKKIEEELREIQQRQAFLLKFSDTLRPIADPVEIQTIAVRLLGEHIAANHVHYAEVVGDYVIVHQAYGNGLPPMNGRFRYMDFGQRLIATYRAGNTGVCYDVDLDQTITKDEAAVMRGSGIKAYVAVPLVKDGEWVSVLGVDSMEPRAWTADEVKLVEEVAERTWAAVERAKVEEEKERLLSQVVEEREKLQTIISSIDDEVWITDSSGNMVQLNPSARKALGHQGEGKPIIEIVASLEILEPDGTPRLLENTPLLRSLNGETVRGEEIRRDLNTGELRYRRYNCAPIRDLLGNITGTVSVSKDISEAKKAEQVLKESEARINKAIEEERQRLYDVLERLPVMVCLLTPNYDVTFSNHAFREKFGEPHGRHCYEYCLGKSDKPCEFCESFKVLETGNPHHWETIAPDGSMLDVYDHPFADVDGSPLILKMEIDISDRRIAEETLNEQQEQLLKLEQEKNETLEEAMKLKDEFLYLITHEFKTPIAVISSVIQTIDSSMKTEVSEKLGRYLNMIQMNTNRQHRLVDNLLDITKMNSGNLKFNMGKIDIVYVTKAILKSVELYALQRSINLSFTSSISKKEIIIDEEKYERIMLNLLSNAVKFTPKGKLINVILSTKKLKNQNFVSISVIDEGIGIPADKQQIIFERFGQADTSMSRQAEGTGLGLHLVELLVKSMGGEISVKSEVGYGSTFTVLLPVNKQHDLFKETDRKEHSSDLYDMNSRIIQATRIEFSDIYLTANTKR